MNLLESNSECTCYHPPSFLNISFAITLIIGTFVSYSFQVNKIFFDPIYLFKLINLICFISYTHFIKIKAVKEYPLIRLDFLYSVHY